MSLIIKQRLFTIADTYDIYDHTGILRYRVFTEFLRIGHRMHIYSADTGEEVGRINERFFAFLTKADLETDSDNVTVTRALAFFRQRYAISNGWNVLGNISGLDYKIIDASGTEVAVISKRLFHLSDTYELEANDPVDELLAMMVAITIDMINCES